MGHDATIDMTFDPLCAFGSDRWCAVTLGKSLPWFRKTRPQLETDGFPQRDRITNYTLKADVAAWINRRRTVNFCDTLEPYHTPKEPNLDGI